MSTDELLVELFTVKKNNYLSTTFTPTEKQIVIMLEEGLSHDEICIKTAKSLYTLRNQINGILRKTEAKNCIQLIAKINTNFLHS